MSRIALLTLAALMAFGTSPSNSADAKPISDFELKSDGTRFSITYKGKKELHQVKGLVTFLCQGGFSSYPRHQLHVTWKPGETKVIVEERGGVEQIQLDLVGHVKLVEKETTEESDYLPVSLRAQWDANGKKVLFVGQKSSPKGFFRSLEKGQKVTLADTDNGYRITLGAKGKGTHQVVRIEDTFVVLRDLEGQTEISIPFHSVKALVRAHSVKEQVEPRKK